MKTWLAFFALSAGCATASAQAPSPPPSTGLVNDWLRTQSPVFTNWDIGGQVRARFESKQGFAVAGAGPEAVDFAKDSPDNNYWLLRETIHLGWQPNSWATLFVEGRDSSSWNDKRRPEPEQDLMDLRQAWMGLGDPKAFPITAKVGRQELIYGDERLIGTSDWNNLGRVFDAAKLRFENQDVWVDVFTSRVVLANDGQFNVSNDYDWFSGVYASTRTLIPKQETQLYFLARNTGLDSPTATTGSPQAGGPTARDIYTVGLRVQSLPKQFSGWDYDAELAGQFGSFLDTTLGERLDQESLAAHVAGGYTFEDTMMTPRVGVEYNYSSGDSDPSDGRHETFDNLFPTNHKSYGFMDFFSWQNMHDVRLNTSVRPCKGLTLTLDYHLFWLADTSDFFYTSNGTPRRTGGYGINQDADSFVGSEIDLVATYRIETFAVFQAGYGHFFTGDYVKDTLNGPGSKDADWVYLQAALNF